MVDWNPYLQSICETYAQWWQAYILTDVVGKNYEQQASNCLLLNLQVIQLPEIKREREVLNVLKSLREYAAEHVLLIGRPGSGKSTALLRLLLEEAQFLMGKREGEITRTSKIPILVELRDYQTSIIDLIKDFLNRPGLDIDSQTITTLLRQGQFFLLIDGVNELPSQEAQLNLQKFRKDYRQTTPMIFTTRDLRVGGDLGISKKLEMQPLTEKQMREFVRAYLPETGEPMLQQLGGRLREFGETPLLLMMLCSVFASNGNQIPPNLGSVFRVFTESHDKKPVRVYKNYKDWCSDLLQQLAFKMMQGATPTELRLKINRKEAEDILCDYLQNLPQNFKKPRDYAKRWLNDLLNHHLIQIGAENKIEFRHQLIQEYYAAEMLLQQVVNLSDDELKWDYFNYLKWTEPAALMMGLLDDKGLALRIVKLALQVDEQLAARLAGSVKPEWQRQTVDLINNLQIPPLFKLRLFGLTKSNSAIYYLSEALSGSDNIMRRNAAKYLGDIPSPKTMSVLKTYLKDQDNEVRNIAAESLGKVASDIDIPVLIKALYNEYDEVRNLAAESLGKIGSDTAIPALIKTIQSCDHDYTRTSAAYALVNIGTTGVVNAVIQELIESSNIFIRRMAKQIIDHIDSRDVYSIGKVVDDNAIDELFRLLDNPTYNIMQNALKTLVNVGSEEIITRLIDYLQSENSDVRQCVAISLGEIGSDTAVPGLIEALTKALQNYGDKQVARAAAEALLNIGSQTALSELIEVTNKYFRREML